MLLLENIFLALNGIKSNKSRSALTMLGIIIGIASVISIMTIGNSMSKAMEEQMSSNGASVITVMVTQKSSNSRGGMGGMGGMSFMRSRQALGKDDYITETMLTKLSEEYKDRISGIGLTESVGEGTAKDGDLYAYVTITGENSPMIESDLPELTAGRYFYDTDYSSGRKVAIVSDYFVNNMYNGDTDKAIGSQVSVVVSNRYYTYTIVGVYEYEEDSMSFSQSSAEDTRTTLYLPLKTAQNQTHNDDGNYQSVSVISATASDATALTDEIADYMNNTFYRSNDDYEISCMSMQSLLDSMTEMLSMITLAISLIAGIALLVGGIGVMNIMMVSITERTKEIGTRKALGATNASIRTQFIVESIVLCIVGGAIGIVLGLIIGSVASNMMSYPASPSILSIFVSVGFSAFIGIFFGYYPANKAAKMNPIDALRYE